MSTEARVPEVVVARLRPHARALTWPSLALFAIVGAFFYFFGSFAELWANLAVLGAAVLALLLFWMLPLLSWLGRHYTITTRRIVLRSGFFLRVRQELLHSRGYDVTVRKNALQSMFRSGDVEINTGLDHPVVLRDVPDADLVQSALHDLMEASINPVAARRQQEQSIQRDETTRWGER
ncbi:PH domain-containing protein [Glaciihabitans arcticus]|uniref:PH domain-containing protein n=1 Tax=Glaciihabitans arcticus TaxID=2668039 RepID=A0A4Q9GMD4_9MICO|nr:PH domain-containing protein [Glaciihabitans arcticus]TBN55932.1 PH domain-containing protein [Glaciihabitans arcticus]